MRSRHLRRNDPSRPRPARRTLGAGLLALVFPLALAGGCGRDEPSPPPAPGDSASAALPGLPPDAPVATYRLATTRSADVGETITIEAIAPCRVDLELEQDGLRQGQRSRDLDPGDATRIAWYLLPGAPEPASSDAPGTRPAIVHRVRYGFDDSSVRESTVRIGSATPSPWIRIANAVPPMSPQPSVWSMASSLA